jgi:hypothetical protein
MLSGNFCGVGIFAIMAQHDEEDLEGDQKPDKIWRVLLAFLNAILLAVIYPAVPIVVAYTLGFDFPRVESILPAWERPEYIAQMAYLFLVAPYFYWERRVLPYAVQAVPAILFMFTLSVIFLVVLE